MKGQEFRNYKQSLSETSEAHLNQLKARTVIALNRLGHQKFFDEPGSYSLENWMKGVNILLDDFEDKMGTEHLTQEYLKKRRELTERLSRPIDVSSIGRSISELRQEEGEILRKFHEEGAKTASKIDELKEELARVSAELEEEKERLSSAVEEQDSRSYLGRLFGKSSTPAADAAEDKVGELESRLQVLQGELLEQHRHAKSVEQHSEPPWADDWGRLESLRGEKKGLENERVARVQHTKEREEATGSIANAISAIPASRGGSEGEIASSS